MKKKTYLFSEVMFGLRDEYLYNYMLLKSLEKYIHVTNLGEGNELLLSFDTDINNLKTIRIDVLKKQSELVKMLNYLSYVWSGDMCIYNHPYYVLKNNGKEYNFGIDYYRINVPNQLDYKVEILNDEMFTKITEHILNSKFMALDNIWADLNQFQSLCINKREITMYGDFSSIDSDIFPVLSYMPGADTIIAIPEFKHGNSLMQAFFDTEIPAEILSDEYREIIDTNLVRHGLTNISGDWINEGLEINANINRGMELNIDMQPKRVVLSKRKNIRFYE